MSEELRKENRFDALRRKYEADIAIAKAELEVYFESSVGVAEHPHIIESMDLLMTQLATAELTKAINYLEEHNEPIK